MKNLNKNTKRVLSFGLALLMALSTMFVGGIQAKADTTADDESKIEFELIYSYLDEDLEKVTKMKKLYLSTDTTYGDIINTIEIPTVEGCAFLGWNLSYIEDYTISPYNPYLDIEAKYDKYPVTVNVIYADDNNDIVKESYKKLYPAGSSMDEICDSEYALLDSEIKNSAADWNSTCSYIELNTAVNIDLYASYTDKAMIRYYAWYIANSDESEEYGTYYQGYDYVIFSNEDVISEDAFANAISNKVELNLLDGLSGVNHQREYYYDDETNRYDGFALYNDTYTEPIVCLADRGFVTGERFERYYVADSDVFYLPTEYNGEKVYWYEVEEEVYYTGSIEVSQSEQTLWMYTEIDEDAVVVNNPIRPEDEEDPVTPPTEDEKDPVVPPTEDEEDPVVPPTEDEEDKNDFSATVEEDVASKIELTDAEKTAIANGEELEVVLSFKDAGATATTEEQKAIEKELGVKKIGTFLEIDLTKKIGTVETEVSETTGLVAITFELPKELVNTNDKVTRTYSVMRYHDGKVDVLGAKYDAEKGTITFETDKFSTYAVVYEDTAVATAPATGDSTNIAMYVMLFVCGAGIILVSRKQNRI